MAEATTVTLADWQEECKALFPGGMDTVAFVCPQCGNVATVAEFEAAGGTADDAAKQCIGRFTGAVGRLGKPGQPCDWAAFGLFGTLDKGRFVELPEGKKLNIFDFASPDTPEDTQQGSEGVE